jgi:hypothetical protein
LDPKFIGAMVAIIGLVITIINLIYGRADKGQATATEFGSRVHEIELAIERLRGNVAEKYATKHELREAVDDIKDSIDRRFDRLESKLDKERDAA